MNATAVPAGVLFEKMMKLIVDKEEVFKLYIYAKQRIVGSAAASTNSPISMLQPCLQVCL